MAGTVAVVPDVDATAAHIQAFDAIRTQAWFGDAVAQVSSLRREASLLTAPPAVCMPLVALSGYASAHDPEGNDVERFMEAIAGSRVPDDVSLRVLGRPSAWGRQPGFVGLRGHLPPMAPAFRQWSLVGDVAHHDSTNDHEVGFRTAEAYCGDHRYGWTPTLAVDWKMTRDWRAGSTNPMYDLPGLAWLDHLYVHPYPDGNTRAAMLAEIELWGRMCPDFRELARLQPQPGDVDGYRLFVESVVVHVESLVRVPGSDPITMHGAAMRSMWPGTDTFDGEGASSGAERLRRRVAEHLNPADYLAAGGIDTALQTPHPLMLLSSNWWSRQWTAWQDALVAFESSPSDLGLALHRAVGRTDWGRGDEAPENQYFSPVVARVLHLAQLPPHSLDSYEAFFEGRSYTGGPVGHYRTRVDALDLDAPLAAVTADVRVVEGRHLRSQWSEDDSMILLDDEPVSVDGVRIHPVHHSVTLYENAGDLVFHAASRCAALENPGYVLTRVDLVLCVPVVLCTRCPQTPEVASAFAWSKWAPKLAAELSGTEEPDRAFSTRLDWAVRDHLYVWDVALRLAGLTPEGVVIAESLFVTEKRGIIWALRSARLLER